MGEQALETYARKNMLASIGSVALLGFAGLILGLVNYFTTSPTAPAHSFGLLLGISVPSLIFLYAGLYFTWRVLRERFEITSEGIRHIDPSGKVLEDIAWNDVRSFSFVRMVGGRGGVTYYFELKSNGAAMALDTNIGDWKRLRDLILQSLPESAEVQLSESKATAGATSSP